MEPVEYEVMAAVEGRHWWYSGMRALSAAWLDGVYGERRDLRILDAGCGTGGNGEFLRRYGWVAGIDIAREALRLGRDRLPERIAGASVVDLPFGDSTFDLVTSFDVLYHRAVIDEQAALGETRRVLRPGGRCLIRVPAYQWLYAKHDRAVHTRRRYTAGEVRAAVVEAGFEVEHISYINSLLFPAVLIQRLLEPFAGHADEAVSDLLLPGPLANGLLRSALRGEAAWLGRGGSFAWGLSVLCLARKPA